jgi:hypothetical protein
MILVYKILKVEEIEVFKPVKGIIEDAVLEVEAPLSIQMQSPLVSILSNIKNSER